MEGDDNVEIFDIFLGAGDFGAADYPFIFSWTLLGFVTMIALLIIVTGVVFSK